MGVSFARLQLLCTLVCIVVNAFSQDSLESYFGDKYWHLGDTAMTSFYDYRVGDTVVMKNRPFQQAYRFTQKGELKIISNWAFCGTLSAREQWQKLLRGGDLNEYFEGLKATWTIAETEKPLLLVRVADRPTVVAEVIATEEISATVVILWFKKIRSPRFREPPYQYPLESRRVRFLD